MAATFPSLRRNVAFTLSAGALLTVTLFSAACTATSEPASPATANDTAEAAPTPEAGAGIRVVSATDAAQIQSSPPADLVVLDVRTAEEFAEGHLEGATMLDFYAPDFADRIAELDPAVPYLLYCRSGNRSGQTRAIMEQLGFVDVADIDGGIIAWNGAGLPVVG